jgi:carbon-monoxide dehydrogenase medium subunit
MNDFEHFEPATLNRAITLLTRYKGRAKLMAGGTDLLVQMKHGVTKPDYVVNLKSIPDLDYICYDDQRKVLRIGSLTTLHSLETSPLMREKTPILSQVAQKIAAPRLRNTGTIGGNLYGISLPAIEEGVIFVMLWGKLGTVWLWLPPRQLPP